MKQKELNKFQMAIYHALSLGIHDVKEQLCKELWSTSNRPMDNLRNLLNGKTQPKKKTIDGFMKICKVPYNFFDDGK